MEYGINVTNKFGFLSDEEAEDNDVLIQKAIQKKNAKLDQEKKALAEKAAAEAEAEIARKAEVIATERPAGRDRNTGRGERSTGRGRGNRGTRAPRSDRHAGAESNEKDGQDEQSSRPSRGGRGRGGRGGDRPRLPRNEESADATTGEEQTGESAVDVPRRGRGTGRGGRGRGMRSPRLDRHSGSETTGVRAFDKKDGHGKGNWGGEEEQLEAADVTESSGESPIREKTEEELQREAEIAKAERAVTLSEFKAQCENKADKTEFKIRMAGEDSENNNTPNLIPIEREPKEERQTKEVVFTRREPKQKHIEIDVKFVSPNSIVKDRSERAPRGSRGRGRGEATRGGGEASRGRGETTRGRGEATTRGRGSQRGQNVPQDGSSEEQNLRDSFNLSKASFPALPVGVK